MIEHYVDIHSHILPNIDDGSRSMEESISMLEKAYDEGVRIIYATPHFGTMNYIPDPAECESKVSALNQYIAESGDLCEMKVVLGSEVLYHTGISVELKERSVFTLNSSKYVLVEFYDDSDYATLLACAREMKMAGFTPIFAHIERYRCLQNDIGRIRDLKQEGVLMQVNAGELIDSPEESCKKISLNWKNHKLFRAIRRFFTEKNDNNMCDGRAWELVLSGEVDFIASDMHGDTYRAPVMKKAIMNICEFAGKDIADRLIQNACELYKSGSNANEEI